MRKDRTIHRSSLSDAFWFLFILSLLSFAPSSGWAGGAPFFSITSTAGDNTTAGGLGNSINQLNTFPGGGSIDLTNTAGQTIGLSTDLTAFSQNVTFLNSGASDAYIDGSNTYQVFNSNQNLTFNLGNAGVQVLNGSVTGNSQLTINSTVDAALSLLGSDFTGNGVSLISNTLNMSGARLALTGGTGVVGGGNGGGALFSTTGAQTITSSSVTVSGGAGNATGTGVGGNGGAVTVTTSSLNINSSSNYQIEGGSGGPATQVGGNSGRGGDAYFNSTGAVSVDGSRFTILGGTPGAQSFGAFGSVNGVGGSVQASMGSLSLTNRAIMQLSANSGVSDINDAPVGDAGSVGVTVTGAVTIASSGLTLTGGGDLSTYGSAESGVTEGRGGEVDARFDSMTLSGGNSDSLGWFQVNGGVGASDQNLGNGGVGGSTYVNVVGDVTADTSGIYVQAGAGGNSMAATAGNGGAALVSIGGNFNLSSNNSQSQVVVLGGMGGQNWNSDFVPTGVGGSGSLGWFNVTGTTNIDSALVSIGGGGTQGGFGLSGQTEGNGGEADGTFYGDVNLTNLNGSYSSKLTLQGGNGGNDGGGENFGYANGGVGGSANFTFSSSLNLLGGSFSAVGGAGGNAGTGFNNTNQLGNTIHGVNDLSVVNGNATGGPAISGSGAAAGGGTQGARGGNGGYVYGTVNGTLTVASENSFNLIGGQGGSGGSGGPGGMGNGTLATGGSATGVDNASSSGLTVFGGSAAGGEGDGGMATGGNGGDGGDGGNGGAVTFFANAISSNSSGSFNLSGGAGGSAGAGQIGGTGQGGDGTGGDATAGNANTGTFNVGGDVTGGNGVGGEGLGGNGGNGGQGGDGGQVIAMINTLNAQNSNISLSGGNGTVGGAGGAGGTGQGGNGFGGNVTVGTGSTSNGNVTVGTGTGGEGKGGNGGNGGNGGKGGAVSVTFGGVTIIGSTLNVIGGQGGQGGQGGNSGTGNAGAGANGNAGATITNGTGITGDTGGNGGNGGDGGGVTVAMGSISIDSSSVSIASGSGGDGGGDGSGAITQGNAGNGGNGGVANATVNQLTLISDSYYYKGGASAPGQFSIVGGNGGSDGQSGMSGNGGDASLVVNGPTSIDSSTVTVLGGSAGYSNFGSAGTGGNTSAIFNSDLTLTGTYNSSVLSVIGGSSGAAGNTFDNGHGITGNSGSASLTVVGTLSEDSSAVWVQGGGDGSANLGNGSDGESTDGNGGDATVNVAALNLTSTQYSTTGEYRGNRGYLTVLGGTGATDYGFDSAGNGGAAALTLTNNSLIDSSSVTLQGGQGGSSANNWGGNGGNATFNFGSMSVTSTYGSSEILVGGGNGGAANSAGLGGQGGSALLLGNLLYVDSSSVSVVGGNSGSGYDGGGAQNDGGNAVVGLNYLQMSTISYYSNYRIQPSLSDPHPNLSLGSFAGSSSVLDIFGGTGGADLGSGNGGNGGTAYLEVSGQILVDSSSFDIEGGNGGQGSGSGESHDGNGGDAAVTATSLQVSSNNTHGVFSNIFVAGGEGANDNGSGSVGTGGNGILSIENNVLVDSSSLYFAGGSGMSSLTGAAGNAGNAYVSIGNNLYVTASNGPSTITFVGGDGGLMENYNLSAGGNGGSVSMMAQGVSVDSSSVSIAGGQGGTGNVLTGVGSTGGNAGVTVNTLVLTSDQFIQNSTHELPGIQAAFNLYGGRGGDVNGNTTTASAATGGAGGSVYFVSSNGVSMDTAFFAAHGGAGGASTGGNGGNGGDASVSINTLSMTASYNTPELNVIGGNGGNKSSFTNNGVGGAGGAGILQIGTGLIDSGSIYVQGGQAGSGNTTAGMNEGAGGNAVVSIGALSMTGSVDPSTLGIYGGNGNAENQGGNGGNGGSASLTVTGLTLLDNSSIYMNGGAGGSTENGVGGRGGNVVMNMGTTFQLNDSSSVQLAGGAGGVTTSSGLVGNAGSVAVTINDLNLVDANSTFTVIAGSDGAGVVNGITSVHLGDLFGQGAVSIEAGGNTSSAFQVEGGVFTGSIKGTTGLQKVSTNTLILGGTNSYSGGTTISDGILALDTNGTLGTSNAVTVAKAGSLYFINSANGGALTIQNVGFVNFLDSSNLGNATINNYTLGTVEFGNSSLGWNGTLVNQGGQIFFTDNSSADAAHINNNSGYVQFDTNATAGAATITNSDFVNFAGHATAGTANITNNSSGALQFSGHSDAGAATIFNAGNIYFTDHASAQSATITNNSTGWVVFNTNSTAGNASIANANGVIFYGAAQGGAASFNETSINSVIDISQSFGVTTGSVVGSGNVYLGQQTLGVGAGDSSFTMNGMTVNGAGWLTKVGTGSVTFANSNNFSSGGGINVAGGNAVLTNNGALNGANLTVSGGNLTIGSAITNLVIPGNYVQTGGTLNLAFGNTNSDYQRLQVAGTVSLGGTLQLNANGTFAPTTLGETFNVIQSTGALSGSYSVIDNTVNGFKLVPIYLPNQLMLETEPASFAQFANGGANQASVAKALDNLNGPKASALLVALANMKTSNYSQAFDQISPSSLSSAYSANYQVAQMQSGALSGRMTSFMASHNLSGDDRTANINSGLMFASTMPAEEELALAYRSEQVRENQRWGGFISGDSGTMSVNGSTGYNANLNGVTAGADYQVNKDMAFGLLVGYQNPNISMNGGGTLAIAGGEVGLYGMAKLDGFYAQVLGESGYETYNSQRASFGGTAVGNTNGMLYSGQLGMGYQMEMGQWAIGPIGSVQYTMVNMNGFQESGSLAAESVASQNQDSLVSNLGAQAMGNIRLGRDVVLTPMVSATWLQEYDNQGGTVASNVAGSAFTVQGAAIGQSGIQANASMGVEWKSGLSLSAHYQGQFDRADFDSQTFGGEMKFKL